jgi:hypothetical protein
MKQPSKNACAMIDAIKAEWLTAAKEKRNPTTLNVLTIFQEEHEAPPQRKTDSGVIRDCFRMLSGKSQGPEPNIQTTD